MNQTKIWENFQNSSRMMGAFDSSLARYKFIANHIPSAVKVLNIGVGLGGLEKILIEKGAFVSCLDPSQETIDRVRDLYKLNEQAKTGFSQSLPFADSEFEVVVMTEVLEHLSDEILNKTLTEVSRVLKPHGLFIGTVPFAEILMDGFTVCPHCGDNFHRWGHVQTFSMMRVQDILKENNFCVVRVETRAFPDWTRGGFLNFIKSLIRYLLGRVGASISDPRIYFEAKKL